MAPRFTSFQAGNYQADGIIADTTEESLVEQKKWKELRTLLITKPIPEVAEMLSALPKPERVLAYHVLPPSQARKVFFAAGDSGFLAHGNDRSRSP